MGARAIGGYPGRGSPEPLSTVHRMAALMTHIGGEMESVSRSQLPDLLAELDLADREHTNVGVQHESGWAMSLFPNGLVVWEHLDADAETGRLFGLSRDEMRELSATLIDGNIEAVAARPWVPRGV